jgi:exopolysaccharide production protein ExoY
MGMATSCSTGLPGQRDVGETAVWRAICVCERASAGALLLLLAPLLAACGAIVAGLSRSSPLVAHRRVGRNGSPLHVFKFRTMWPDAARARRRGLVEYLDPAGNCPEAVKPSCDPRVTSGFARLLRRYSIDELPQLANVLLGEMSLVGPRPLTAHELRREYGERAEIVLRAKPGITGLWQVSGRSRLGYPERRALDLRLVEEQSLGLYLAILARTIPAVLSGRDAW